MQCPRLRLVSPEKVRQSDCHPQSVIIIHSGGKEVPLAVFSAGPDGTDRVLVMEILDVKQAAWPEPSAKVKYRSHEIHNCLMSHVPRCPQEWTLIRQTQEIKFGWDANGR